MPKIEATMTSTRMLAFTAHAGAVGVMRYCKTDAEMHYIQLYPEGNIAASQYQAITTSGLCDVSKICALLQGACGASVAMELACLRSGCNGVRRR